MTLPSVYAERATDSGPQAVSFGETVFDRFDDGISLGGAPLNFACYLRQFGVSVALVSAVGRDELGESALRSLGAANVDSTWVESRPEPTGTVDVRVVGGEPEFTMTQGSAWEQIGLPGGPLRLRPTLVYFGTAAQQTTANQATLGTLLSLGARHALVDVNLRPCQFSPALVVRSLTRATILKMNEQEWQLVREITSKATPAELMVAYGLEMVALTRGSGGAELHLSTRRYVEEGPKVNAVDQVGAGDAFSAALAAGVIRGAEPGDTLRVATEAGAAAVQAKGALVDLPDGLRNAFD